MYRLDPDQREIVSKAAALADAQIAPYAEAVDRDGRFPRESIAALASAGFLGLTVPAVFGGMGQGPRTAAAVLDTLAQRCSSTAMVYLMHLCGVACYTAAPEKAGRLLEEASAGRHLATLAFSEQGSRSQFWAPVSRLSGVNGTGTITAQKSFVTSAGHAAGYVVSTLAADAATPLESSIFVVLSSDAGVSVSGVWEGLGMRGNASAPLTLHEVPVGPDRALTASGRGLDMMLGVVLPLFQMGSAATALGIAEAAVSKTTAHLTSTTHEHLGTSLAQVPGLRTRLAQMRIETDRARAHLASVLDSLETPGPATQLLVLEVKAAATEAAVVVTELAMRACGGAAFRASLGLERLFRDARAPIVMSPSTDQAHDFIGRALCGLEVFG